MANRLRPAGAPPPKKKAKKAAKPKAGGKGKTQAGGDNVVALDKSRKNICSRDQAIDQFEEVFELHRELGEVSGAVRKKISDAYATGAKKIGVSKKVFKHLFKLEKTRREVEAAEAEFLGNDRDGFLLAAQIFGDDTPFGAFALAAAGRAKKDGFGGTAGEED